MKAFASFALLSAALFCAPAYGEDSAPPKQATKEEIQARLAEHARKKALGPIAEAAAEKAAAEKSAAAQTPAPTTGSTAPAPAGTPATAATTPAPGAKAPATTEEAAKLLPKVEVKRERITELDRQVQKQNAEIAREKKNSKPTKLDETLNGPKVSSALAIFGGQSSDDRANISKERVSMMEDERDLIEAIAHAETKEEKEELEKTLTAARAMRRDLETSLR